MIYRLFFSMFLVTAAFAANPPRFIFQPKTVAPGGSLTVSGWRFSAESMSAGVSVVDEDGQRTILGPALLVGGGFRKTFPIPADLPPGRYLVHVADSSNRLAINLIGTLTVTPTTAPWFEFAPSTVAPGQAIGVSASGFSPASTWATVGVVDGADKIRLLGFAALNDGGFSKSFPVPISLAPDSSYQVFVQDSSKQFAQDTTGPLTLSFKSVKPTIPVGDYPIGAAVNPFTNRIYVPNGGENTVSVLDGVSNAEIGTVPVGELPCAIGMNPLTNRVYIANVNTNDVSVLDAATNTVIATVGVGSFPCAVGVIPWADRIYVGNYGGNSVTVLNGATNTVVTTIPVGGPPFGIGVNPVTNRVYVATGFENTVTVLDGFTNDVVTTVPVGKAPDAVGVNTAANRVYVGNYFSDTVTVLDGSTHAVLATVPVGREPDGIAVDSFTGRVYITNYASNTVSVLNGFTNAVIATLPVGITPDGLALNPFTHRVYIVNSNTDNVSVLQNSP